MTQSKIQDGPSPRTCDINSESVETPTAARDLEDAGGVSKTHSRYEIGRPDTRSPYDPWHEEGYLIRCLIRLHGWSWQEAGLLRRNRRG